MNEAGVNHRKTSAATNVTIGFSFNFHLLRKWCEVCKPITERSPVMKQNNAKIARRSVENHSIPYNIHRLLFEKNTRTIFSLVESDQETK